eukprot:2674943-Amphidinium_carterae.1
MEKDLADITSAEEEAKKNAAALAEAKEKEIAAHTEAIEALCALRSCCVSTACLYHAFNKNIALFGTKNCTTATAPNVPQNKKMKELKWPKTPTK